MATSFDLRASVAENNNKTYTRLATDKKIGEMTAPGTGPRWRRASLTPRSALRRNLTGQTPEKIVAKQDAIYSELAKVLTRDAASSRATFQAIDRMGHQDQATLS